MVVKRIPQFLGALAISASFLRSIAVHASAAQIEHGNYFVSIASSYVGFDWPELGVVGELTNLDNSSRRERFMSTKPSITREEE